MRASHIKRFFQLAVLVTLGACGVICPSDTQIGPVVSTSSSFPSLVACEAARTAATACPLITAPDGACIAYCTNNWWPCIASATKPSSAPGAACFPNQADNQYYFSCVAKATCHCV